MKTRSEQFQEARKETKKAFREFMQNRTIENLNKYKEEKQKRNNLITTK